jgi:hypothetical protein
MWMKEFSFDRSIVDELTLEREIDEKQVWVLSPTLLRKMEVEHFISKRTHTPITLMFLVNMWCLSHLFGWVFDL